MSRSPGGAWWISDQRTGFSTVYNGAGATQSLIIAIPQADQNNKIVPTGTPTGIIFNGSQTSCWPPANQPDSSFPRLMGPLPDGTQTLLYLKGPAALPSRHAVAVVKTGDGSSYTGLTIAFINGKPYLYAANFTKGRVDVYDSAFHPVRLSDGNWSDAHPCFSENSFVDENLPRPTRLSTCKPSATTSSSPMRFQQRQGSPLETDGPGLGFVDIYSAPWGVAVAPADFGRFSHNLLIGQFAGAEILSRADTSPLMT